MSLLNPVALCQQQLVPRLGVASYNVESFEEVVFIYAVLIRVCVITEVTGGGGGGLGKGGRHGRSTERGRGKGEEEVIEKVLFQQETRNKNTGSFFLLLDTTALLGTCPSFILSSARPSPPPFIYVRYHITPNHWLLLVNC